MAGKGGRLSGREPNATRIMTMHERSEYMVCCAASAEFLRLAGNCDAALSLASCYWSHALFQSHFTFS